MVRVFLLIIYINSMALGVVLDSLDDLKLVVNDSSSSFGVDPAFQLDENLRFGGSTGLFFLNLLKYKLKKLQYLDKISTTSSTFPNCICVPYYQCDINNNVILDGVGAIDIRYRACAGNLEVCCYLRIVTPMTPAIPTTPMLPATTTTTRPPTMSTMAPTTTTTTMAPTTITTTTTTTTMQPTTTTTQSTIPTIFPPFTCFCVNTWQCDSNGFIVPDGSGVINPRQTSVMCPLPNQVCCRINPYIQTQQPATLPPATLPPVTLPPATQNPVVPPNPSIDPRPYTPPSTLPTLPPGQTTFPTFLPGQTCICILIVDCNVLGYIPVNGAGNIDPRYTVGSLRQMGSSCSSSMQVCCRIIFSVSQVLPTSLNTGSQEVKYPGTANACVCVKSWTCPADKIVYPEGFGIIDPRFGACPIEDEVCCRLNNANVISSTGVPFISTRSTTLDLIPENSCGQISKMFAPAQAYPVSSGNTYFAEFPWMVALLLRIPGQNDVFLCGASMINSRVVLTAGHCVENHETWTLVARFGEWDTNTTNEPMPFQEARIQTVIRHPQYYNAALYHDLAILILQTPVMQSVNVMPICLPQQGQVFPPGTRCYASGWGRSAFGAEGKYQSILRKIDLPLIDNADCQNRLKQTRLGQYFQLHGSFLCAGGEESRDTCRGDGGGPLVCPTSTGQYVQVGIVSWGIGCGTSNPAVYASVAQHRLWIDQQLANNGVS